MLHGGEVSEIGSKGISAMLDFRIVSLCWVLSSLLPLQFGRCAESKAPLYVISSSHKVEANDFILNRLQPDHVAKRDELGGDVAYGYSDERLAIMSEGKEGLRIRSWELSSGEKLSDVRASVKLGYRSYFYGASQAFVVDDRSGQILGVYPGREEKTYRAFISFEVWDLASGESYVMSRDGPELAGGARWLRIHDKLSIKCLNGDIGTYDPASHSVRDAIPVKGIAKQWDDYFPQIGLVRHGKSGIEQLSDADFQPLAKPRILKIPFGPSVIASGVAQSKGHPAFWSVSKAGVGECEIVVRDLLANKDSAPRRSPIAATAAFANADATRFILADTKKTKRAVLIDPTREGELANWSFSWADDVDVIPVFEK